MKNIEAINKKGPIDNAYIVGMNGTKVGVYASSIHAAKQKAIEHFRPKKKQVSMIWVVLAEDD